MAVADDKMERLHRDLRTLGSAVVAFSGGVDSTFLMAVSHDVLQDQALAVTVQSELQPATELSDATEIARARGWRHRVLEIEALALPALVANPPQRCYHCKRAILQTLQGVADREGLAHVIEGTTADDLSDVRPGRRAVEELGVGSPLLAAGFTKQEIRDTSKAMGLPTWDRPSLACLASRIPFGTTITRSALQQIDAAETALRAQGFTQVRVRHHGDVARIEVEPEQLAALVGAKREGIVTALQSLGFRYVAVDLKGYRTGSLHEALGDSA